MATFHIVITEVFYVLVRNSKKRKEKEKKAKEKAKEKIKSKDKSPGKNLEHKNIRKLKTK